MFQFYLTTYLAVTDLGESGTRTSLGSMPLYEFQWWIVICLIALHTVVAVIVTELMTRTYGKWWLWLLISFGLPIIGSIAIFFHHALVSGRIIQGRKLTFWARLLANPPVSLVRAFKREMALIPKIKLRETSTHITASNSKDYDPAIENLLNEGLYGEARAIAWKMMEIADSSRDSAQINRFQEYLEVIAEREALANGK